MAFKINLSSFLITKKVLKIQARKKKNEKKRRHVIIASHVSSVLIIWLKVYALVKTSYYRNWRKNTIVFCVNIERFRLEYKPWVLKTALRLLPEVWKNIFAKLSLFRKIFWNPDRESFSPHKIMTWLKLFSPSFSVARLPDK